MFHIEDTRTPLRPPRAQARRTGQLVFKGALRIYRWTAEKQHIQVFSMGNSRCAPAQRKMEELGVDVSAEPQARAGQQVLPIGTTALEARLRPCPGVLGFPRFCTRP